MINIQVLKVMFNKMDSCIKMNRGGVNLFYRMRYGMGIVWNYLRYKATISDYFELRFFEKNSKEKKEYLTSKDGLRFAQYVDSQEVFTQLCSKKEMYRELKKYVNLLLYARRYRNNGKNGKITVRGHHCRNRKDYGFYC